MKIYFGHSREVNYEKELYEYIRNDRVLSKENIILPHEKGYEGNNSREFYANLDLFIAEVSYPSTGLGIELGWAYDENIPIICIYKTSSKFSSSLKVITNNFYEYKNTDELISIIKKVILKK